jgi:hypothetical protein
LLAGQRLLKLPDCGGLFSALDANGVEILAAARYSPARDEGELAVCSRPGVWAFTRVHGVRIYVCVERFRRLDRHQAAMALIHEALHQAGLSEHHLDPAAPTPAEINQSVRQACSL